MAAKAEGSVRGHPWSPDLSREEVSVEKLTQLFARLPVCSSCLGSVPAVDALELLDMQCAVTCEHFELVKQLFQVQQAVKGRRVRRVTEDAGK